jgi:hypothetical protein
VLPGESLTHAYGLGGLNAVNQVVIDNSQHIAYQTMHRHQVADRNDIDQIYPQRPELLADRVVRRARGSHYTGQFPGKMIMVQGLMDESSWANNALYYQGLVEAAWGPAADEHYRVWFVDHSLHPWWPVPLDPSAARPARNTRVIDYNGIVQQALRDVAAWVEKGVQPPGSTVYEYHDGQVVVAPTAKARMGIQPVVTLDANGAARAEVTVGEAVHFTATVEVPPSAGTIVAAEWDFDGSGDYPLVQEGLDGSSSRLTLVASHTFAEPGTYFPVLRAISQRQGDGLTPFARVQNLGRVRVVVR